MFNSGNLTWEIPFHSSLLVHNINIKSDNVLPEAEYKMMQVITNYK